MVARTGGASMAHPEQDFGPVAALGPEHHHNADLRRKARARPAPSRPNRRGLCGKSTGFVAIAGPNRPIREDHRALFNAAAKAAARSGLQSGATCSTAPAISILTTPAFIIVPTGAGASAGSTLSGTKLGPSSTSRTNFPFLARPRHCERCRAISPCFAATSQTRAPGSRLSATIRSRSLSDRWRSIAPSHRGANAADRSAHPEPHPAKLPCDWEPPSGAQFGAPQPSSRKHHLQASMTENPKGRNHGGGRTAYGASAAECAFRSRHGPHSAGAGSSAGHLITGCPGTACRSATPGRCSSRSRPAVRNGMKAARPTAWDEPLHSSRASLPDPRLELS